MVWIQAGDSTSVQVLLGTASALVNVPLGVVLLFGSFWYNSPGSVGVSWSRRWSYLFGSSSGLCGGLGSAIAVAVASGETIGTPARLAGIVFFAGCALLGWWQVGLYRNLEKVDWDMPRRWPLEDPRERRRELRTVSRQGYLSVLVGIVSLFALVVV